MKYFMGVYGLFLIFFYVLLKELVEGSEEVTVNIQEDDECDEEENEEDQDEKEEETENCEEDDVWSEGSSSFGQSSPKAMVIFFFTYHCYVPTYILRFLFSLSRLVL